MRVPDQVRRLFGPRGAVVAQPPLDASTIETLTRGLQSLAAGDRGWISFDDYGRLFEGDKPRADRFWRVGTTPPGPTWWIVNARLYSWARSFEGSVEWRWTAPPALALAALASRHRCTPVRVPADGRFYFMKDRP